MEVKAADGGSAQICQESGYESLRRRTAVPRSYHTLNNHGKMGERKFAEFLAKNGLGPQR